MKLRWGCVPGKSSAEEWLRKEREGRNGDTLRPTRRELADRQFGLGDMEDDAAGWVTMGRWQGCGQMDTGSRTGRAEQRRAAFRGLASA